MNIKRSISKAVLILLLASVGVGCSAAENDQTAQVTASVNRSAAPEMTVENQLTADADAPDSQADSSNVYDCANVKQIPSAECEALAAFFNSTGGPNWADNDGWLKTNTPCSWAGIYCEDGHVSHISLFYNQLQGTLPPELGSMSELRALELWVNQLQGAIPVELGNLAELISLDLSANVLTGPVPDELGNLSSLQFLSLAHNQIGGSIPVSLGHLSNLSVLDLANNQLHGSIPEELGQLANLARLDLSHNQLSGTIPFSFSNLGALGGLNLSYNQLSGSVPESVVQLAQRKLWGNELEGTITSSNDEPLVVDAMNVRFTADSTLGDSIWPAAIPATALVDGEPIWYAAPEHLRFTFADSNMSPERQQMGINLPAEAQLLIYRTSELTEINTWTREQVEILGELLEQRGPLPAGELPLLPNSNASQMFQAQARFLESADVQGLRFVTQLSQEAIPVNNQGLFYTFQGFSTDGANYVTAFFPLTTDVLPDKIEVEDWDAFSANYATYIKETASELGQLPLNAFEPDITLLDAVVLSLNIDPFDTGSVFGPSDDELIFEALPSNAPLVLDLDQARGLIAYQKDRKLWLHSADLTRNPTKIAECLEKDSAVCSLPQVHWSPDGSYFFYEISEGGESRLIISDLEGRQQGYRLSRPPSRDPVWSPDGSQIILFVVDPKRPWGNQSRRDFSELDLGFVEEVWQLQRDEAGMWSAPKKVADLETLGIGCGGGGASTSDYLYDVQGGFTLGSRAARQMVWTRDEVIIYPLTCDYWYGYGRLDAQTWKPLPPLSGHLRGLTLDSSGSHWYAVTGHNRDEDPANNRLVTGTADSTEYEVIETAVPVEMVFVGPQSGRLYYTSRVRLDHIDLSEQIKWDKLVEPYFNFYHSQLWTILPDGTDEKLLWEGDDHSYSRVTEAMDGEILFVLIENDVDLYETVVSSAPEEAWLDHLPHTHIMRLSPRSSNPEIWLEDAHNLIAWYPTKIQD